MNDKVKAIRERHESAKDYGIAFGFTWAQMGVMLAELDAKDQQIAELENNAFEKYWADNQHHSMKNERIVRLEDANAGLKTQLQKGAALVRSARAFFNAMGETRGMTADMEQEIFRQSEWLQEVRT